MLIVCRAGLAQDDFERLRRLAAEVPYDIRWSRRRDHLVLQVQRAVGDEPEVQALVEDPSVDHVLRGPSNAELGRLFSRRELLDLSLAGTGVIAGAALLAPLGLYLSAPAEELEAGTDVFVGRADAIPEGDAQNRIIGDEDWLVIRRTGERYHALSATCTHSQVCLVGWDPERAQAVCPCHRGVFDLYGNVVSGPPPRPLEYREVIEREGNLYLKRRTS